MGQNRGLVFLILLILPISGFCELSPYKATYTLYWRGLKVGKSIHTVQKKTKDCFVAEANSKPLLSFLPFTSFEKSEFCVKENKIFPSRYTYNLKEKNKHKSGEIYFNQPSRGFSIQNPMQDKISLYFQLRHDLLQETSHTKKTFRYTVIEPKGLKTYVFNITEKAVLKTPLGVLKTIQVEHISNNGKRITKFWLAKDLDYMIIKLQQIKNGKLIAESHIQDFQNCQS